MLGGESATRGFEKEELGCGVQDEIVTSRTGQGNHTHEAHLSPQCQIRPKKIASIYYYLQPKIKDEIFPITELNPRKFVV